MSKKNKADKKQSIRVVPTLLKYLFAEKRAGIILVLLISGVSVVLSSLLPYFTGVAIDAAVSEGAVDFPAVYAALIKIGIIAATYPLLNMLTTVLASRASHRLVTRLRREVFEKTHALPLAKIDPHPAGELASLMINDPELIIDGLTHVLVMFFASILTIVASLVIMLTLNLLLAAVVIVITPAALFAASYIGRRSYKAFSRAQAATADYNAYTNEIITEGRIVTAFNYERQAAERGAALSGKLRRRRRDAMFYSSLANPIGRFLNNISYIMVGLIGGLMFVNGVGGGGTAITVGVISSLLLYANQYSKPMNELTSMATEIQNALSAAGRMLEFLAQQGTDSDAVLPELAPAQGDVDFESVDFQYLPEKPLITGFSLDVRKGEKIAIVGPTGSGKTTLVNLLMRFYDPVSGKICIDGQDTRETKRSSVRRQFGMVLQDTWLKTATIRENLLYGNPDASEAQMLEAARLCRVDEFVSHLPEGYDTLVTEVSYRVSQGEKQLITIARAMLLEPAMLILDEATSAIDTRTELLIQDALETVMQGKTTFIIAHRLSTIVNADKILVLKNGRVEEVGNHNELLAQKGFYYELYNSQFKTK